MTKKLFVVIIAIVLVAAIAGSCFALYYTKQADKQVTISTAFDELNLQIKNAGNTAAQGTILLDEISPDNRTKTIDVTLTVDQPSLVDGIHGLFTVGVSNTANTIGAYITTTVKLLNVTKDGEGVETSRTEGSTITTDALGDGYDVALSSVPVYVRLSFYLNDDGVTNFATIAETTASITLDWQKVVASVWTLDSSAYYVVGTLSGANKWDINATNANTKLVAGTDPVIATTIVTLAAEDQLKVRKGDGTWVGSYSSATEDFTNSDMQIYITNAGSYRINVKHDASWNNNEGRDYFEIERVS